MFATIITITYNAEQWIERTLKSVLMQTDKDYEYLIIDGASADSTMDIVRRYEPLFEERMKHISEPDEGLYYAMNKGLQAATGDFVWFMNAGDEIYTPDTLRQIKEAYAKRANNNTPLPDILYGKALTADATGKTIGEYHKTAPKHLTRQDLLNGLVVCHQAMLVRRDIAPLYDTAYRITADYDWVIRLTEKTENNLYIDDYLCRFLTDGLSQRRYKQSWKERFRVMHRHFGLLLTLKSHLIIAAQYLHRRL